jgi:hypothetical protein
MAHAPGKKVTVMGKIRDRLFPKDCDSRRWAGFMSAFLLAEIVFAPLARIHEMGETPFRYLLMPMTQLSFAFVQFACRNGHPGDGCGALTFLTAPFALLADLAITVACLLATVWCLAMLTVLVVRRQ